MVIGNIENVRAIAGHVQEDEMNDDAIEGYMAGGTSYVENRTGVSEADWPTHDDYNLAIMAAENYAAAFAVLVVSTVKDATARHKELLMAADTALAAIAIGSTDDDENPFFINENSEYMTYENNPLEIEPYESTR